MLYEVITCNFLLQEPLQSPCCFNPIGSNSNFLPGTELEQPLPIVGAARQTPVNTFIAIGGIKIPENNRPVTFDYSLFKGKDVFTVKLQVRAFGIFSQVIV